MDKIITKNDYKVFKQDGRTYMFIADTGRLFETEERTIEVLDTLADEHLSLNDGYNKTSGKEDDSKIIKELIDANVFFDTTAIKKNTEEKRVEEKSIGAISLLVTQTCNLRCTYCYGEDGQYQDCGIMDCETALKSVDFFVNESPLDEITICFFGGEPLLNFKVIKEVVTHCRRLEKETNKRIRFSMTTNGTLITDEISKFIEENRIAVQISLDGDEETQNKNRFDARHVGSYDRVIKNTKTLREKGLLGVRATLTPFNMNVKEIYRHLDSLGFRKIIISPAFNMMSDGDYDTLAKKYIEWYLDLENELKKGNYDYVRKAKLFRQELTKIDRAIVRTSSCGVGKNMVAIDIHGNIFPCQRFVALKDYSLGDIDEGITKQKDFVRMVNEVDNENCEECWIRNLCVSGCPFCNTSESGDMHLQNKMCCEYEKKVYAELINIYLRLTDKEKKLLFNRK